MSVIRLYPTIQAADPSAADSFYGEILGLDVVMDLGWVRTMASEQKMPVQVTFAKHSGPNAPMTDLSVEVDDFDAVLERVKKADFEIIYGPVLEPWGLKRFFVRDPFGKIVNILAHNNEKT